MNYKDIPDFIVRFVIILLLFAVLFLNVIEISNFVNSRVKMLSLSSKDSNPSYDSLNLTYCKYYSLFPGSTIDRNNLYFVFIYFILVILFWLNKIINIIFNYNTSLSNEIKILFYKTYFNNDIYKNYNDEYNFINGLRIFILVAFAFHSFIFYNEYNQANNEDMEIHKRLVAIDSNIIDNIDCDLINSHDTSKGKYITEETLGEHLKKEDNAYLKSEVNTDKYLKICISIILTNKHLNIANKTIDVKKLCSSPECIYSILENNVEDIFPENISDHIDLIKRVVNSVGNESIQETHITAITTKYTSIRDNLIKNYYYINNQKASQVINYKFKLITIVLLSIFFATFGLVYFLIYDIKWINKQFSMDGLPLPFDYFLSNYFKKIIIYLTAIISIYIAFVINF
jgi:hypothetical protein